MNFCNPELFKTLSEIGFLGSAFPAGKHLLMQVYTQVAASRNRLSQQLSAKNKYIWHLERTLDKQYQVGLTSQHDQSCKVLISILIGHLSYLLATSEGIFHAYENDYLVMLQWTTQTFRTL